MKVTQKRAPRAPKAAKRTEILSSRRIRKENKSAPSAALNCINVSCAMCSLNRGLHRYERNNLPATSWANVGGDGRNLLEIASKPSIRAGTCTADEGCWEQLDQGNSGE